MIKGLKPDNVESINVLKGKTAIEKYGEKGKNGVIEIYLKKIMSRYILYYFSSAETASTK